MREQGLRRQQRRDQRLQQQQQQEQQEQLVQHVVLPAIQEGVPVGFMLFPVDFVSGPDPR
jgi:hypothetical protein